MRMKKTFLIYDKDFRNNDEEEPLLNDDEDDSIDNWQVFLSLIFTKKIFSVGNFSSFWNKIYLLRVNK